MKSGGNRFDRNVESSNCAVKTLNLTFNSATTFAYDLEEFINRLIIINTLKNFR